MKKYIKTMPYLLWSVLFTIIPLIFIIYFSFKEKDSFFSFTISNYLKFFNWTYVKIFIVSLRLSIISTILCLFIGFPAAKILSSMDNEKKRGIFVLFFIMPLWTNFLLRTYSWMSIFREQGIVNQFLKNIGLIDNSIQFLNNDCAIIVGMIYNFLPFMVLPIYTSLIGIDRAYIDVARDLGARTKDLYLRVILPLSFSGIVSGCIMVFMPSITTFIISDLLGGSQKMMLGNLIQREFLTARNWETGSSISVLMIIIVFLTLIILKKFTSKDNSVLGEGFKLW